MIFHVTAEEFVLQKQMKYSSLHPSEGDSPGSRKQNSTARCWDSFGMRRGVKLPQEGLYNTMRAGKAYLLV